MRCDHLRVSRLLCNEYLVVNLQNLRQPPCVHSSALESLANEQNLAFTSLQFFRNVWMYT